MMYYMTGTSQAVGYSHVHTMDPVEVPNDKAGDHLLQEITTATQCCSIRRQ